MKKYLVFGLVSVLLIMLASCGGEKKDTMEEETMEAIKTMDVEPFTYVALPHTGPYEDHQQVIGEFISEAENQGLTLSGPMLGVYYNDPSQVAPEALQWEIGFKVEDSSDVKEPLVLKKWDNPNVVAYMFFGSPDQSSEAYTEIEDYMSQNNLTPAGPVMERFLNPHMMDTPPESLKTEIWFPYAK